MLQHHESFLMVLLTFLPGYFLALLLASHPFLTIHDAPWLCPMLAPLSDLDYVELQDPLMVRRAFYCVVVCALLPDGLSLRLFGRSKRREETRQEVVAKRG